MHLISLTIVGRKTFIKGLFALFRADLTVILAPECARALKGTFSGIKRVPSMSPLFSPSNEAVHLTNAR